MPEYLEIHWIVKSMPEYLEIHWIVKSIRGKVSHFIVKCVSRKGKEFTNEECKKAENLRLFLEELPEEFEILSVEQRGKEVALICESFVILIQSFGQGSYLYYLDHEWNTSKEPFQSDGFLIFEGINKQFNHYGALVLIDCRTSHHQFVLCKRPLHSYWSKKKGPCILSEPEAFIKNLKNALENEPITFKNHSIAWILLNQKYFHGIGEYTASEILFRLYKKYGIKPFDNSWKVLKNPVLFDAVICAPRSYYEESKSFGKKFNPACVGRKQKIAAKHFRLNFLRVYGKKVFRSQKIVPVAFKLGGDFHTVYMLQSVLMNSKVLPSGISKSKKRPEEASKLPILDNLQTLEQWHVVRGKRFTKNFLFVGPFEWHLQGEIPTLRKNGLLVNKFDQKGPKETPAGPHHRKRKNPRSGHKAEKLKQHKHFSTSTNKIE